ncbi:effector-associated constant component EACC1 [Nocardia grenadensis]|uniref:effector-associated constant component EACC1 n=1 Tax=Nocardia grenadensis TaxID=931537 RepID=UPI0007A47567|nr:hypothetical protein [Nocardia grenadensis]
MPNLDGQLLIHTEGGPDAAVQLLDWLYDDDGLRGRARLQENPVREGEMGVVTDVVTIALGSGATVGIATALARSLTTWLTHRRSDVTITVTRAGGNSVKFNGKWVNATDVLRQIQDLAGPTDTPQ